jgi:hypothetical protein
LTNLQHSFLPQPVTSSSNLDAKQTIVGQKLRLKAVAAKKVPLGLRITLIC